MRKKLLIAVLILVAVFAVVMTLRHSYALSAEYNFITAKLDIKNGEAKFVHVGVDSTITNEQEINIIAARYGFKNIYISPGAAKEQLKGIKNYNELIETFLAIRNGQHWRADYQREVDDLLR